MGLRRGQACLPAGVVRHVTHAAADPGPPVGPGRSPVPCRERPVHARGRASHWRHRQPGRGRRQGRSFSRARRLHKSRARQLHAPPPPEGPFGLSARATNSTHQPTPPGPALAGGLTSSPWSSLRANTSIPITGSAYLGAARLCATWSAASSPLAHPPPPSGQLPLSLFTVHANLLCASHPHPTASLRPFAAEAASVLAADFLFLSGLSSAFHGSTIMMLRNLMIRHRILASIVWVDGPSSPFS